MVVVLRVWVRVRVPDMVVVLGVIPIYGSHHICMALRVTVPDMVVVLGLGVRVRAEC